MIMLKTLYRFCSKHTPNIPNVDGTNMYLPKGSIYELGNAQKYVEDQVRKYDWPGYAASKHYPKQIRQDFVNLCYMNVEMSKIDESSEPSLALGKVDYWVNVIDQKQIYADQPVKEPFSIALHHSCKNNPLPKYLFQKILNAKKAMLQQGEFATLLQMAQSAELTRGPQLLLFLRLLRQDIEHNETRLTVEHVSRCLGILDLVKRIPYTLRKYKLMIPEDIKTKYSVNVRSLWNRIDGQPKEELYDCILEVSAYARQSLAKASPLQASLPPQAFRAFLHATEAEQYLETLEKYNFRIFEKSLNTNSYLQLPYRLYNNVKQNKFLQSL